MPTKKIIGIIPSMKVKNEEDPYEDAYLFVNLYCHKVYESGAIPIGLLLDNRLVNIEQLELCDAFIYPGGSYIDKRSYEILLYAYTTKKPVLGICLGMQAMCIFSVLLKDAFQSNIKDISLENLLALYKLMSENHPVLTRLPEGNIHSNIITNEHYEHAFHLLNFKEKSYLASIYGSKNKVLCMHSMKVNSVGDLFDVVGTSEDGVIEAIESKDKDLFWLGVQFHPEFLEEDCLIKDWINKIKKY